ncbi:Protein CAF40 [Glycine soja]
MEDTSLLVNPGEAREKILLCSLFTLTFYSSAAHIPIYLYPFLNTTRKSRLFEYLRLTTLGVIGALVKYASGDISSIMLWDVDKEQLVYSKSSSSDCSVSVLVSLIFA